MVMSWAVGGGEALQGVKEKNLLRPAQEDVALGRGLRMM